MNTVMANTIWDVGERKPENASCEQMIHYCGHNTGNVCFCDAVLEQFNICRRVWCYDIDLKDDNSVYIIPAANWISEKSSVLKDIMLKLEKTNVKLLILGLGVQMGEDLTPKRFIKRLPEETVKALKILGEHTVSIGVRGGVTAEVLDLLGIHNYEIIGCPSFYEQYRLYKGVRLKEASSKDSVLGIKPGNEIQHKLIEMAYLAGSSLILQGMDDLPLTLIYGKDIEKRHVRVKFPGLDWSANQLKQFIMNNGKIFYTRKSWSEFLINENKSFSFGSRFHGNMMAFSNGIKALWVRHDIRINEMVEAMKLPNIKKDELKNIGTVDDLIDSCCYDKSFEKNYIEMSRRYISFLERNGAEHTFGN